VRKKSKLPGADSKSAANGVSQRDLKSESAMVPTIVSSIPELLTALRARRDELEITNESIDNIAGLSDRHASKLLAKNFPSRNLGKITFPLVLQALGLGIGAVVLLEDPEEIERVSKRWVKRKRQLFKTGKVTCVGRELLERAKPHVLRANAKAANRARNAILTCEQKTAISRHAAKCRWRKAKKANLVRC
jgi:hypothetical protein